MKKKNEYSHCIIICKIHWFYYKCLISLCDYVEIITFLCKICIVFTYKYPYKISTLPKKHPIKIICYIPNSKNFRVINIFLTYKTVQSIHFFTVFIILCTMVIHGIKNNFSNKPRNKTGLRRPEYEKCKTSITHKEETDNKKAT